MSDSKSNDTGAGVSVNDNLNESIQTPPASINEDTQHVHSRGTQNQETQERPVHAAYDIPYETYYNANNSLLGVPKSPQTPQSSFTVPQGSIFGAPASPMYIRVLEDPEEAERKKKVACVSLGISALILCLLGFFFISFLIGSGSSSQHTIIKDSKVKFKDVQGCDEVKGQLEKIVKFLKDPSDFNRFGAKIPRGYLLAGPPGVGKTMLAKAVAGESKVPFITISGAEFEEKYVGVGAARVRALFKEARSFKKAVIFIDEIDAVAGKRDAASDSSSSSHRATINQLLVEMDGFKTEENIVVLAATNSPDSLDPAILRPGRFDKTFHLSPPDINGRAKLLKELLSSIPEERREAGDLRSLEVMWLAKITIGYTGADLANLINHAKMIASLDKKSEVLTKKHIMEAKSFVDLGPTREIVLEPADKERIAYHEAGHAVVALIDEGSFSVQYATIIPQGSALGLVSNIPEKDFKFFSLKMYKNRMDGCMAGFIAEKLHYASIDDVSTGAADDLQKVNKLARDMVLAGFGKRTKFLHPQDPRFYSEASKKDFEDDMKDIMNESEKRVEEVLTKQKELWENFAKSLLQKGSLNREEIMNIYKTYVKN